MIRRALRNRGWQMVIVGVGGVMCALLGAVLDQWRVSVLGFGVVALGLLGLSLLIWRAAARTSRRMAATSDPVSHSSTDASSLTDDRRMVRVFDYVLTKADVPGEVERRLGAARAADREEMADLIRLVTRHDAAGVSLPLDSETSPSSVLALLRVMQQKQVDGTLVIGGGATALWAANAARGWGGRVEVVCSPDEASEIASLTDACGLSDQLHSLALPLAVPATPEAVRPWWDLAQLEPAAYDLVAIVPGRGACARPAIPALPLVLDRMREGGYVLIDEASGAAVVGPAWAASSHTVTEPFTIGGGGRHTTFLVPAGPTDRTDDELAEGDHAR